MANERRSDSYSAPLKRLFLALLVLALLGIFALWRIDSPRVEAFRAAIVDAIVPRMEWAMAPVTGTVRLARNFQSYRKLSEQNQELRRELRKMQAWKEAAVQLEQENARLLDLNKVQLDPRLTYVSGKVIADSGSPFRQSVLLNVGRADGIVPGWAAMDGIGVVGRIEGVGDGTARVILLTDSSSRIPALIQPSGQRAIIAGDNTAAPVVDFVENRDALRPGDRVVSSGDGGVFPDDLLIGQIAVDPAGRLRLRPAADLERLEFLRILRHHQAPSVRDHGQLVARDPDFIGPVRPDG